jgi:signal transduction histidine kinase
MRIQTLRGRLYFLLAQWLVVYLAASVLIGYWSLRQFRSHVEQDRLLLARTVSQYLSSTLLATLQSGARLASDLPAVDERAIPQLRAFRFQGPFRDAVYLVDAAGRARVSDPPFARLPEIDWVRDRYRMSVTGLLRDGTDAPVLAMVVPFVHGGESFYLVAKMKPRGSPLSVYLQNLAADPDLHVVVADESGTVIAAPDHAQLYREVAPGSELGSRVLARRPLVLETDVCHLCIDGPVEGKFLTVMVPLRIAPWGVVIQQDERRAFSVLRASQVGLLVTTALLAVMGVLLSRGLSRSVISPVQELSRQAEQLRQGDLETPVAVDGDREITVLARSLDQARERLAGTMGELRSLNAHLEESVAGRTRELSVRYEELELLSAQRKVLVRRLLAAGEEERRRIARELHDEISQLLTVIQLSLERVADVPPGSAGELEKVRGLLARTQKEVHRIIYDLRPSLLDDLGLAPAVKWYAASYLDPEGIDVGLEVEEDLELPPEVEITTFRIYQEIVTNILRHSKAEHVSVELYAREGSLVLAVEDDGVGFELRDDTAGAGLTGIRERASLVGGRVSIDSEPGMGTHVLLEIPLAGEATGWGEAAAVRPAVVAPSALDEEGVVP